MAYINIGNFVTSEISVIVFDLRK